MISKTNIARKAGKKTNADLQSLIIRLKKKNQLELAHLLALPRRKAVSVNLDKLDKETKTNEAIIVPGKVLGTGTLAHPLTLAAFSFSATALSKLKNCTLSSIEELAGKPFRIVR